MTKSKSPKKDKSKKGKTPRDPYNNKLKRGLKTDEEIANEKEQLEKEEGLKKFGPCHFDATECMTAILMLQSDEQAIVIGALNCLQKFQKKRPENAEILEELGGIKALAKLVNSNNRIIQRLAMKNMTLASKAHKGKLAMRDLELIQDFNNIATSNDEVLQEYATFCLSNLATLYTGRLQLIQHETIPILLKLLEHPDADIIRNAIESIWRLLEDALNIELLLTEEQLQHIVNLIDSEYPTVQVIAMSVLARIAMVPAGTDLLSKMGLIENVGNKLSVMEMGDLHRVALKLLRNMGQAPACCAKMSIIINHLVNVINKTSDEKTLSHAVKLSGKISSVPGNAHLLLGSGFGEKLVELLACDNMKLVAAAAMAAAQISKCDAQAMRMLVAAIESLLDYAESPDITMQGFENVMATVSHVLTSGKPAAHLFLEWGGRDTLEKIFKNFKDYSDDVLISTMICLHNLSMHWAIRSHISGEKIIVGILAVMEDTANPQLLVAGATALVGLLCEKRALVALSNNGGIKQIKKLIQHQEYPVIASAGPIVHVAGTYEDIAYELIEQGVLEELWKRSDLIGVNGPLRTAFERLLCSNLSAKFAIAGHLDPFEKLNNGFYDYGLVKSAEGIIRIHQLKEKTDSSLNLKRILYLNLSTTVNPELVNVNPILTEMITNNDTTQNMVDQIRSAIDSEEVSSERDVIKVIARVVSDKFGGVVDNEKVSSQGEDMDIATLQTKFQSVLVPITLLSIGLHRPRAILFKAMADVFGIPCSLERGNYGKVWNVVLLRSKNCELKCACNKRSSQQDVSEACEDKGLQNTVYVEQLRRFVVDLVANPGNLLQFHSYDANAYCFF